MYKKRFLADYVEFKGDLNAAVGVKKLVDGAIIHWLDSEDQNFARAFWQIKKSIQDYFLQFVDNKTTVSEACQKSGISRETVGAWYCVGGKENVFARRLLDAQEIPSAPDTRNR